MTEAVFLRRLFLTCSVVVLLLALWLLRDLLLLVFAAVLVAMLLASMARRIMRFGVHRLAAVTIVMLASLAITLAVGVFFGQDIVVQSQGLATNIKDAWANLNARIAGTPLASMLENAKESTSNLAPMLSTVLSWSMSFGQALLSAVLVLVGAFYMAISETSYRTGVMKLVPAGYHDSVHATLDDIASALNHWIGGQLVVMIIVGTLTAIGLTFAGVKSAVALGLLAGLANLVPYLGSIVAAALALLIAASQGAAVLTWAAGVMFVIQQLESNVITPIVLGRAVSIEPAVGMFALVAMGILFGPLGILLGFPLTIVFDIAIRRLYVRDALDKPVEILGHPAERSQDEPNGVEPLNESGARA